MERAACLTGLGVPPVQGLVVAARQLTVGEKEKRADGRKVAGPRLRALPALREVPETQGRLCLTDRGGRCTVGAQRDAAPPIEDARLLVRGAGDAGLTPLVPPQDAVAARRGDHAGGLVLGELDGACRLAGREVPEAQ